MKLISKVIYIVFAFAGLVQTVCSCNPSIDADVFECSFILDTPTVTGGGDFSFTIVSNHEYISLKDYHCDDGWVPEEAELGDPVKISSGRRTFKVSGVAVEKTRKGKVNLTVRDEATGAEKSFSAIYLAQRPLEMSLSFNGVKPNGSAMPSKLSDGCVAVVEGGSVSFTVESAKGSVLTLVSSVVPFESDGVDELKPGREWVFQDGYRQVVVKDVKLTVPVYDGKVNKDERLMRLRFRDEETGRECDLTAPYIPVGAFSPEIRILSPTVYDGEFFKFDLSCPGRSSMTVVSYQNGFEMDGLKEGTVLNTKVELGASGVKHFESKKAVSVSEDYNDSVILYIKDSEFLGDAQAEPVMITGAYSARMRYAPSSIEFDRDKVSVSDGETAVVRLVQGQDGPVDYRYATRIIDGDAYVASLTHMDNEISVKGRLSGGRGGKAVIRVTSQLDQSVYKDFEVTVRHRVVLVLEASFKAYSYDWNNGSAGVWQGLPERNSMLASLAVWEGSDLTTGSSTKWPTFYPLYVDKCAFSADFGFVGSPTGGWTNNALAYFYGVNREISMRDGCSDANGDYKTYIRDGSKMVTLSEYFADYPKWTDGDFHSCQKVSNFSQLTNFQLSEYADWLRFYGDICQLKGVLKHLSTAWTKFSPEVRNVSYNSDILDFRGVVFKWRHSDFINAIPLNVTNSSPQAEWPEWNSDNNGKEMKPWFFGVDPYRNQWFIKYE